MTHSCNDIPAVRTLFSWSSMIVVAIAFIAMLPVAAEAQDFGLDGGEARPNQQQNTARQSGVSTDGKFDVRVVGASRTIKIKDIDRDVEIVEDERGPVSVSVSRTYTSNDIEELARKSPKLAEYLKNIPPTLDGLDVEVAVKLSNSGSADTPQKLEKSHKGLFNIYKRYLRELNKVDLVARNNRSRSRAGQQQGSGTSNGPPIRPGTTATSKYYDLPTANIGPDSKAQEKAPGGDRDN